MSTHAESLAKANITVRKAVANILSVYSRATDANKVEGSLWYPSALQVATDYASAYGVSVECAVTVIAHMSPRLHWSRNIAGAAIVLSGQDAKGFMGMSVKNAKKAIASNDPLSTLNGNKVKAFAANILGDENAVTIDVWSLRVIFGDQEFNDKITTKLYDAYAHSFRLAAKRIGISPRDLQAICWTVARNGRSN